MRRAAQEWQQIIQEESYAICTGECGEVFRVWCGMAGVRVGEAAPGPGRESRRRPRVSSSDDSDCAPLVSVGDALERDLA